MSNDDIDRSQLEDSIVEYLKEDRGSTLRSRYFDVRKTEGKREYAKWLAKEIQGLSIFIDKKAKEKRDE